MTNPYKDDFENWGDVQSNFDMKEPEPEQVLLAQYSYEDYSGSAEVLYRNGDKYFYVSGSHCSCYGLEGQWEPEEYDVETLIESAKRAGKGRYSFLAGYANEVLEVINHD